MATLSSSQTQTPPQQEVSDTPLPQQPQEVSDEVPQPQTPPGQQGTLPDQVKKVQSTPPREGLGSISKTLDDLSPQSVRKNLEPELKKSMKVSFSHFLYDALLLVGAITSKTPAEDVTEDHIQTEFKTCITAIIKAMEESPTKVDIIKEDLREYLKEPKEEDRYKPFVHATNTALVLLKDVKIGRAKVMANFDSDDSLIFLRHDPTIVESLHPTPNSDHPTMTEKGPTMQDGRKKGSTAQDSNNKIQISKRKPDVICALKKHIVSVYPEVNGSAMKLLEVVVEAPQKALVWKHHKSCVELKVNKKDVQFEQPAYDEKYIEAPLTKYPYNTNVIPKNKVIDPEKAENKVLADCAKQCADNATKMFYNTFGRNHVMNLAITDDILRIWHFDHECPITTSGMNFIQDLPYFLLLLYALQRFSSSDWGYIDQLNPVNADTVEPIIFKTIDIPLLAKPGTKNTRSHATIELKRFKETKDFQGYRHYGLGGRSTQVIYTQCSTAKQDVAVKLSSRERNRVCEGEFLRAAKTRLEKIKATDVCEFLPTLYYDKEFPEFSTDKIRKRLGLEVKEKATRVPYLVLLPKYKPITSRTSNWETFYDEYMTLIYCHFMLWSVGIEHRDISESNLMWDPINEKPKLCDFDLSHFKGPEGPAGSTHTATWMFMAHDLLDKEALAGGVERLYRYDLESYIAVFVWIIFRYNEGRIIPETEALKEWTDAKSHGECAKAREDTYKELVKTKRPEHLPPKVWNLAKALVFRCEYIVREGRLSQLVQDYVANKEASPDGTGDSEVPEFSEEEMKKQEEERKHSRSINVISNFLFAFTTYSSTIIQDSAKKIKARIEYLDTLKFSGKVEEY